MLGGVDRAKIADIFRPIAFVIGTGGEKRATNVRRRGGASGEILSSEMARETEIVDTPSASSNVFSSLRSSKFVDRAVVHSGARSRLAER